MANSIKGTIYDLFNSPLPNILVKAFDQDLRKETLLGEANTDAKGHYSISYNERAVLRAEKKTADVFLRVFKGTARNQKELGASKVHFNVPNEFELNFKIDGTTYQGLPEYDALVAVVEPLLVGQRVKIHQLKEDDKHQDISFLEGETGEPREKLELLPLSHQFATKAKLEPDIFYGLFRMSFPQKWDDLFSVKRESIKEGIEAAIEDNIISSRFTKQLKTILKHFDILSSQNLLKEDNANTKDLQAVLDTVLPQVKDRKTVVDTWINNEYKAENFFKSLEKLPGFRNGTKIKALQHGLQINSLTLKQPGLTKLLIEESKRDPELDEIRGFSKFEVNDWKNRINKLVVSNEIAEFPKGIKGETKEEKTAHYATTLKRLFNEAFPTTTFAFKMQKDRKKVFESTIKADLKLFFTDNPDFDLETTRIKESFEAAKKDNIRDKEELLPELKNINRLYKLSPNYEHVAAVRRAQLTSSSDIVRHHTESTFVSTFKDTVGEAMAKTMFTKATQIDKKATALAISYRMGRDIPIYAMQQQDVNLQDTFGDNLLCECNHCQSLYSPAAYFVDLLNFLRKKSDTAYKELLGDDQDNTVNGRRPDLQHILLTCQNTNTPLPYIDLVNEILEEHIAPTGINSYQTTLTANELAAYPEHTNEAAYNLLKDTASTPLEAFLNLPWEETQMYLKTLGIKRYNLMQLFYGNNGDSDNDIHIATEVLGLSPEDLGIIYGNITENDTPITLVKDLLYETGLSYRDVLQMLECQFINPVIANDERTIGIVSPSDDVDNDNKKILSCDIDKLEFSEAINLNSKVFRFLRLWKRLGWSMYDVDRTLRALGITEFPNSETDINADLFIPLSHIVRLKEEFALAIPELLSLWHPIDEVNYIDHHKDSQPEIPSLFKRIFQNKESAVEISDLEFENEPSINEDYKSKIIALFNLSQDESLLVKGVLTKSNVSRIYRKAQWLRFFSMSVNEFIKLKCLIQDKDFDNANDKIELLEAESFESALDYLKFIKSYSIFNEFDIEIDKMYSILTESDNSEDAMSKRRQWYIKQLNLSVEEYLYIKERSTDCEIEAIWDLTTTKTASFVAFIKFLELIQFRNLLKTRTINWYTIFDKDTKTSFKTFLSEQSKISIEELDILVGTTNTNHLGYTFNVFRYSGKILCEIVQCAYKSQSYNTSSKLLIGLTGNEINGEIALTSKNLLKSKYDEEAWLNVIKPINNALRGRRRDALLYILHAETQEEKDFRVNNKIEDINDLYAHFLIDLEMSSCMMSSRIKQAISSVQLFIDRCLMGIESNVDLGNDFAHQWNTWRKQYRVWEANRKIFLYPENWIEPELRDDKSPFFKELESKLMQNDMTNDLAEDALREYLEKLDQVANLEIIGLFPENREIDGQEKPDEYVHVIGRTKNSPHIYFYRKQLPTKNWTAWERIDLDIEGDHILPVVQNRRLLLFWGIFEEKETKQNISMDVTSLNGDKGTISSNNKPKKYLELKLAWSEFKNDKWGRKKISESIIFPDLEDQSRVKKTANDQTINHSNIVLYSHTIENDLYINGLKAVDTFTNKFEYGTLYTFNYCSNSLNRIDENFTGFSNIKVFGIPSGKYINHRIYGKSTFSTHNIGYFDFSNDDSNYGDSSFTKHKEHSILTHNENNLVAVNTSGTSSINNHFHISRAKFIVSYNKSSLNNKYKNIAAVEYLKDTYLVKAVRSWRGLFIKPDMINDLVMRTYARNNVTSSQPYYLRRMNNNIMDDLLSPELPPIIVTPNPDDQPEDEMDWIDTLNYKYKFILFRHPYACHYLTTLSTKGIDGIYNNPVPRGYLSNFNNLRFLNFGLVLSKAVLKPFPKPKLDFDFKGSYSQYNWELFFHIPLLIASRLNSNQRFEEARKWFHYIFDPTTVSNEDEIKFWKLKPFKTEIANGIKSIDEILLNEDELEDQVNYWEQNPFNPHAVARFRISAFMRTTFTKYIDNLIDWADQLFRRDSMESINEAIQLYVLTANLLGEKPEIIPERAKAETKSFQDLLNSEEGLDALSNTIVEVENYISQNDGVDSDSVEYVPYFCLPRNKMLLGYWDNIYDKLFKIRNCMNIQGQVRELALFEPEIDPALLIRAQAAGLDLNTVLNDTETSLPNYRFQIILQKANEVCNDVKSLGAFLLSALEKKDAEELSLLRSGQEIQMLELVKDVRRRQRDESKKNLEVLLANRKTTEERKNYYESRQFMNAGETVQMQSSNYGLMFRVAQASAQSVASIGYKLPDFKTGSPFTTGLIYGGAQVGQASDSAAKSLEILSAINSWVGNLAGTLGSYKRRMDDWKFQAKTAELELKQIDKQIIAAEIRFAIAEKELENHEQQIENTRQVDEYLNNKFSKIELYNYMVSQISDVYFQSYKMAYDLAKKSEKCYEFELDVTSGNIIQFGHWDSLKKGLLSGEKLQYDLRRLDTAYMDNNKRKYEMTKHISLRRLDPLALLKLKTKTDNKFVSKFTIPEWLFDLDCPGHYKRRIKSVSLSIPAVTGPYTTLNCKLKLIKSKVKGIDTPILQTGNNTIVTSSAQNDSGMFEFSLRDERYLPFEGAGVNSLWELELPSHKQFDYGTISDVILQINYTALDDPAAVSDTNTVTLEESNANEYALALSLEHDFPYEWHKFKSENNNFVVELKEEHFPYFALGPNRTIVEKRLFTVDQEGKINPEDGKSINSPRMNVEIDKADLVNTLGAFIIINYSMTRPE